MLPKNNKICICLNWTVEDAGPYKKCANIVRFIYQQVLLFILTFHYIYVKIILYKKQRMRGIKK